MRNKASVSKLLAHIFNTKRYILSYWIIVYRRVKDTINSEVKRAFYEIEKNDNV